MDHGLKITTHGSFGLLSRLIAGAKRMGFEILRIQQTFLLLKFLGLNFKLCVGLFKLLLNLSYFQERACHLEA
jgi:hypothetical protein